jgi:(S)-mandelate dehydrogenase
MLIKGILSAEDARKCVSIGADGVVVSNHGGRQLDGAITTLEALPRVAEASAGKLTVLADGGLRRGSDVVKALALGAKAVVLGRTPLYGVAAGGQQGASLALQILLEETTRVMSLIGCESPQKLDTSFLSHAQSSPAFWWLPPTGQVGTRAQGAGDDYPVPHRYTVA